MCHTLPPPQSIPKWDQGLSFANTKAYIDGTSIFLVSSLAPTRADQHRHTQHTPTTPEVALPLFKGSHLQEAFLSSQGPPRP